jgi:FkbM family methyltransferase
MKQYSQNNEQQIILNYFANHKPHTKAMLDVGAFDGEIFSNTRALMQSDSGWTGVFAEPSSFCFAKLLKLYEQEPRRVKMLNAAVVSENKLQENSLLTFYDFPNSTVSSIAENHTKKYGYEEKNEAGDIIKPYKIYIGQIGLKYILETFGPFDFINIDVEGQSAELALQDWFNPRHYMCKLLCIEHDGKQDLIANKFAEFGYKTFGLNAENIIIGLNE